MQKCSFFPGCPFQRKLLFFQTIESARHAFAARAGSRKFLENEKQNGRKNYGAMFTFQIQGHMQKLSSFRGKTKNRPKKSLMWFFHAALHLNSGSCMYSVIRVGN